ncbi:protein phosphatase 2C domain-containing protein [Cryptosporangium sp. NPDC048952]|uniref:protein phosphatase 2C domain-containing protein n=1 Tax=Cryptosporangium sp. NPDC048952 TaxID=3363961 RepID=UPI00370F7C7C
MTCTECSAPTADSDHFCESCGTALRPPGAPIYESPVPTALTGEGAWLSSGAPPVGCAHCGAKTSIGGYCGECGRRLGAGRDRAELDLPGVAALTDRGHHRHHNEDAVAIGVDPAGTVAIVCDGVSSTPRADAAAVSACNAALPTLLRALADRGLSVERASREAFDQAFLAVDALVDTVPTDAPSCTYVSGVVRDHGIVVGWVGDSRAYWIPEVGPPRCLTVDDAVPDVPGAPLTRWLGGDAPDVELSVVAVEVPGPGTLLLCTDGLSRYLAAPTDLAFVAGAPPVTAARRLVDLALDAGGVDNIAVAVLAYSGGVSA